MKGRQYTWKNIEQKLKAKILIDDKTGCWLWQGNIKDGYGRINFNYRFIRVHRLSAHLYLGFDLNSDEQVNHKPTCPNKNCCNPEHLYIGTQWENINDIVSQGGMRNQHSK